MSQPAGLNPPRRIAVLGSNSFSGAHLVDTLLQDPVGHQVLGTSRSPEKTDLFLPYKGHEDGRFTFAQLDMARPEGMRGLLRHLDDFQPHCIVNFAALNEVAPSNEHPHDYFHTNCVALAEMCHHLRKVSWLERYIHISSPEVYGTCDHALTEDAPMNPSTPYAASKGGADLLLGALYKTFGFPVIWVRPTNYYGKYQQLHKLIPRTVIRLKMGERMQMHGGGKAIKSWLHVRDVARALVGCMQQGRPGEIYHLSDENAVAVRDIVERICALMGRRFEDCAEVVAERPGQDARYLLDYSKAVRELGWKPQENFDGALAEVVEWIEGRWDEIMDSPQSYTHIPSLPTHS